MNTSLDAYRYFFPAGWALGLWGVLLWLLFPWGWSAYPGLQHPEIMTGGFFLCFVAGFLMTAAPRFTSTHGPTRTEHTVSGALIVLLFITGVFFVKSYFYAAVCGVFVFLIRYVFVRFRLRKGNPPDSFVFLGFGLLAGLLSSATLIASDFVSVPVELRAVARIFFMQTYVMCMVVGVGSRLVPALMGFAPLPVGSIASFIVLAVIFVGSYIVEVLFNDWLGVLIRALILAYIFLFIWKIYRPPARKAAQTYGLWVSAWSILLGQIATVVFFDYRIHILHVILICGLALMTLMIAVRVSLSHGKHDMSLEKKSRALIIGGVLIFFAGLTRLSAGFTPAIYQSHLEYAAVTWILGMLVWGTIFIPRILRVRRED